MGISNGLLVLCVSISACVGLSGCDREVPTGKTVNQGSSTVNAAGQAADQAADTTAKTPLEKARGVEGTLEKAADRTADTVTHSTQ